MKLKSKSIHALVGSPLFAHAYSASITRDLKTVGNLIDSSADFSRESGTQ
jgi:hypothetical protein